MCETSVLAYKFRNEREGQEPLRYSGMYELSSYEKGSLSEKRWERVKYKRTLGNTKSTQVKKREKIQVKPITGGEKNQEDDELPLCFILSCRVKGGGNLIKRCPNFAEETKKKRRKEYRGAKKGRME